jgi:hypothetical protein
MQKSNMDLKTRAALRDFDPRSKREIETARAFAGVMAALMLPSVIRAREAEDSLRQIATNIDVTLALCEFWNRQSHYPEYLEELTPKYLDKTPADQFTGGSPIAGFTSRYR